MSQQEEYAIAFGAPSALYFLRWRGRAFATAGRPLSSGSAGLANRGAGARAEQNRGLVVAVRRHCAATTQVHPLQPDRVLHKTLHSGIAECLAKGAVHELQPAAAGGIGRTERGQHRVRCDAAQRDAGEATRVPQAFRNGSRRQCSAPAQVELAAPREAREQREPKARTRCVRVKSHTRRELATVGERPPVCRQTPCSAQLVDSKRLTSLET